MDHGLNEIPHWWYSWNSRDSFCVPDISEPVAAAAELGDEDFWVSSVIMMSLADVSQAGFKGLYWHWVNQK